MSAPGVTVRLPPMLAELVGGAARIEVAGATLGQALDDLLRQRPKLRLHLVDESGALRRHILCFCNGSHTRDRDVALRPGDTVAILHSVAGG